MIVIAWMRIAATGLLAVLCLPLHLIESALGRGGRVGMVFLHLAGWICGLRVRVTGRVERRDVLLLGNHVSWLDILAVGGRCRARFVSKDEVRGWPLIGWLAMSAQTLFIDRADRGAIRDQAGALADAVGEGRPVALFPEGTTGDGVQMLPFKPSLLASMYPARHEEQVQTLALIYDEAAAIAWTGGEGFGANAMRLLRRWRPIRLHIVAGAPFPADGAADRKALAKRAEAEIAAALGASAHPAHGL